MLKIIKNLTSYVDQQPLALSIGMFDGVHLGHQKIVTQLNLVAAEKKLESAILTFWPHPRSYFNPNDDLKLLNTLDEKTCFLQQHGLQNLFLQEFDEDFRNLSGEDFVRQILVDKLHVKHLIIGYDHTFGKNKSGDFALLQKMASEFGFEVQQISAVVIHEKNISSTKIRTALEAGNLSESNSMLGYFYPLTGKVIHGKKLGRTLGYPTANLGITPQILLPKSGAYIVNVLLGDETKKGMLSIGKNPTVSGDQISVEVYILDFDGDLYGRELTVEFRAFLHEEIKFDSLKQLTAQLHRDKKSTEAFFTENSFSFP